MPDEMSIEVHGLSEVLSSLSKYNNFQAGGALTKGLNAAGKVLFDAVLRATPVRVLTEATGGLVAPGDLANALRKEVVLSNNLSGGAASVWHQNYAFLVNWLEYGHKMMSHKPQRPLKGPRTPDAFVYPGGIARNYPFMRKAADQAGEAAIDAFVSGVESAVAQIEEGQRATAA